MLAATRHQQQTIPFQGLGLPTGKIELHQKETLNFLFQLLDPSNLKADQRKAFLLNLYNLLTLHAVAENGKGKEKTTEIEGI